MKRKWTSSPVKPPYFVSVKVNILRVAFYYLFSDWKFCDVFRDRHHVLGHGPCGGRWWRLARRSDFTTREEVGNLHHKETGVLFLKNTNKTKKNLINNKSCINTTSVLSFRGTSSLSCERLRSDFFFCVYLFVWGYFFLCRYNSWGFICVHDVFHVAHRCILETMELGVQQVAHTDSS